MKLYNEKVQSYGTIQLRKVNVWDIEFNQRQLKKNCKYTFIDNIVNWSYYFTQPFYLKLNNNYREKWILDLL